MAVVKVYAMWRLSLLRVIWCIFLLVTDCAVLFHSGNRSEASMCTSMCCQTCQSHVMPSVPAINSCLMPHASCLISHASYLVPHDEWNVMQCDVTGVREGTQGGMAAKRRKLCEVHRTARTAREGHPVNPTSTPWRNSTPAAPVLSVLVHSQTTLSDILVRSLSGML